MNLKDVMKWLFIAAVCVNTPRYMITFLMADSIRLPPDFEALLLIITAVGTGIVLTGGGAVIAHILAFRTGGGKVRAFLMLTWIFLNVFGVILLTPAIMLAVSRSELAYVLSPGGQWWWSVVSIISVEWLAAAAMAGYSLFQSYQEEHDEETNPFNQLSDWLNSLGQNPPSDPPPRQPHTNSTDTKRRERDR
jgi:hypothetical protein